MALSVLRKHIRRLEQQSLQARKKCNCLFGQATFYHQAAELARISEIRCPVHEFRDLGEPICVPNSLPLRQEDQDFCSCPPSAVRDFLRGKRGPLIKEEQAEAGRAWEMEFTEDVLKKFRIDEAQVRRLLERYERDKRRAHANSSAMSKQDKRR